MAHLHADVLQQQSLGPVLLVGDLNAHLGQLQDGALPARCCEPGSSANPMGDMFMDLATRCHLITTTGRLQDVPVQPSWRGAYRLDHAFVQEDLWPCVSACGVLPDYWGSDHCPLLITWRPPTGTTGSQTPVPIQPAPFLRWDYKKQHVYSAALGRQAELQQQLHDAVCRNHLDCATTLLSSMIWNAAAESGLVVQPADVRSCVQRLKLTSAGVRVKRAIRRYRSRGQHVPASLRARWRTVLADAERRKQCHKHKCMRQWLCQRPRTFWSYYRGPKPMQASGISTQEWYQYYLAKFGSAALLAPAAARVAATSPPLPSQPPDTMCQPVQLSDVLAAFQHVGTAKCPGADHIPAEFITKACVLGPHPSQQQYVLMPVLMDIFNAVLAGGHMPASWTVKCIHPIYKSGGSHLPQNYRPIAVATSYYRLFTAVLGARLSSYCQDHPDMLLHDQFAFRKEHSVEHSHLVLLTARDLAKKQRRPFVLVELDVSKAYDTVDRRMLWDTLHDAGLPGRFVAMLQDMYSSADYVVLADTVPTPAFHSTTGLLQGCALSPMLYNFYLKPCLLAIRQRCQQLNIGVYIEHVHCVALNYADDMQGLLQDLDHVQQFIDIVSAELALRHQHLNLDKCRVMLLNSFHGLRVCPSHVAGIRVVDTDKVLGVMYAAHGSLAVNLKFRAAKGQSKLGLILARLKQCACLHDLSVANLVLDADLRATLLFACGVWGSYGLSARDPVCHPLQKPYSSLMRVALGVAASTAHWSVNMLMGQLPLQLHIIHLFASLWNRYLVTAETNPLVRACLQVQHSLMHECYGSYWLQHWVQRLQVVLPPSIFHFMHDALSTLRPIPHRSLLHSLAQWCDMRLHAAGDPMDPACPHRKIAMVFRHFHLSKLGRPPPWHVWCADDPLPRRVWQSWVHFVSADSALPVHTLDHHPFVSRLCPCATGQVGDEHHLLFACPFVAHVRHRFAALLDTSHQQSVRSLFVANRFNNQFPVYVHELLCAYQLACDRLLHGS